MPAFPN